MPLIFHYPQEYILGKYSPKTLRKHMKRSSLHKSNDLVLWNFNLHNPLLLFHSFVKPDIFSSKWCGLGKRIKQASKFSLPVFPAITLIFKIFLSHY